MDPTPHPALLKQPPPPQSNPEPPRDVVTVSDTLESPQSGVTASLNSESKKDASQHTDTATAANTAAHTDAAVAQATVSHLTDVAPKNGLRFSEQAQHPLGSVAVTQLKGYSPRADDSKGYSTKPEGSKGLTAEGNSPCGSYSPDAPDAAPTVSTASESATDKPSISAKHSVLSMTLDSAVSTPASSADVISQHLDTDGDQVMGSHDEASSFGNKQGADQQAQQHSSDGIHEAPASSKGSPIASNAPDNAERFQRTVDSAAGEDALPRPSAAHEMLR